MERVYLDYSATTPIDPEVVQYMMEFFDSKYGNPSSMHGSGRLSNSKIKEAKQTVANCLNCEPSEIIFTGSGTESDNMAIVGAARANKKYGNHIIISAIEHKAVMESAEYLKKEGFEIEYAPVSHEGLINVQEVLGIIREDTILVSIMYANNEIGTIEPIEELFSEIRKNKTQDNTPILHTDACQVAGNLPIDVVKLGADLLTINSSKIYGPKGVGVLYIKKHTNIDPIVHGGGQENGLRAGTESLPQILGMAYALRKSIEIMNDEQKRLVVLREYLIKNLQSKIPDIIINGSKDKFLNHIVHVTIPSIEGESIVLMLDSLGIEVSTGSACSSNDLRPSHVLVAIGQNDNLIHGSVRFSLGRFTTKDELDYLLEVFPTVIENLRKISVLTTQKYGNRE